MARQILIVFLSAFFQRAATLAVGVGGWPVLLSTAPLFLAATHLLLGYLRLRRVRRALRIAASAERIDGCYYYRRITFCSGRLTGTEMVPVGKVRRCPICTAPRYQHCDPVRHGSADRIGGFGWMRIRAAASEEARK